MTTSIIISIVALVVIISVANLHKKNKKTKEIHRILDEKNRIFSIPTYSDYIDVTEVPCEVDLPLPKVTLIIYFVGIKGSLFDSTRGILYAHFNDLWKSFIDLSMLKGVSSEMLRYSFPGNNTISGEPIEIYNKVISQLSDGNTHMFFIRYDSVKGFMLYDSFGEDGIDMSKRAMSYILYIANGYAAPTELFYRNPLSFKTQPTPLPLPNFDNPDYDSEIRFRVGGTSSDYIGSIPSKYLDGAMANAKPAQQARKSTDER